MLSVQQQPQLLHLLLPVLPMLATTSLLLSCLCHGT